MNNSKIIGINIHNFRKIQGLSQQQIASYLGVTRELISFYESGNRTVSIGNLNRLADLFGVELADLLEEDSARQESSLACAFRSEESEADLENIASFKRIVMNYLKIEKLKDEG